MTYELREFTNPCSTRQIKTLPSYADAVAYANAYFTISVFSEDKGVDYPAADFMTKSGRIIAIQPAQ